jgi:transcription elongation factor GreA-like protein/transcription elongation GreA/GreB family factor
VEQGLGLFARLEGTPVAHQIFKLIIDLQTTNAEALGQCVFDYLRDRYQHQKNFVEKIRLIGLRSKESFQGAVSNYELLSHMEKGNFVFHTGGWGVGEILDVSLVREQLGIEFDYVPGRKDLSFTNAFKTLLPIPKDHFLAMRFGNPDLLEQEAKENPVEMIRQLLRDLGPKSASDIKDELCGLVIPEEEWTKWWQAARAKIKKDTMIQTPKELKEQFVLRQTEVTHEERLQRALEQKPDAETLVQMVYTFMRDFPEILKNNQFKTVLQAKLHEALSFQEITPAQELQIQFFLNDLNPRAESHSRELIRTMSSVEEMVGQISIGAFKKRLLAEVREERQDWKEIFLKLLLTIDQNTIRDYIFSELQEEPELQQRLGELLLRPSQYPDAFLWYFQKLIANEPVPFGDVSGRGRFFESFLILLAYLENNEEKRDLVKKIHAILSAGRYAIVRKRMQEAQEEEVREYLLLATKCHSLSDHDIKILYSLAEVAHPAINKAGEKSAAEEESVIWTTPEGYQKLQQKIQRIGTIETIENAREIEIARSHGDLRENQEFKSALEKRNRLQTELKFLSDQLHAARILTKEDVSTQVVGVGTRVDCQNQKGEKMTYTLLGPLEADPEKQILSFQSKLAQTMKGLKKGGQFQFHGEEFTVIGIHNYFSD